MTAFRFRQLALTCCVFVPLLRAEKLVVVRAVADATYAQRRAETSPPSAETYVIAKGQYFSGITYDRTLERMPFQRIAETLACDLKRQNYLPASSIRGADLVIVVHWGVTLPNDRGAMMMALNPDILRDAIGGIEAARVAEGTDDVSIINHFAGAEAAAESNFRAVASDVVGLYERNESRGQSNADLLGLTTAMAKERNAIFGSEMGNILHEMADEERYFIIMVAYDAKSLRDGKKRRLWTTRMSIRSAGVNFAMGLDRMSNAGAKSFGTRQEDLAFETQGDRPGIVKVGELKVINSDAPKKP